MADSIPSVFKMRIKDVLGVPGAFVRELPDDTKIFVEDDGTEIPLESRGIRTLHDWITGEKDGKPHWFGYYYCESTSELFISHWVTKEKESGSSKDL